MQNNIIIVINGKPRSGKDTFCKYIEKWCEKNNKDCYTWSTIDLEKEILEEIIGRSYEPNNKNDRAFLSEFKQLLNKYYDITFDTFKNMIDFFPGICLVHSREWEEILNFGTYCESKNIPFITIYMESVYSKDYNNNSDKYCSINLQDYDIIIENNGTLEDLKEDAEHFCESRLL